MSLRLRPKPRLSVARLHQHAVPQRSVPHPTRPLPLASASFLVLRELGDAPCGGVTQTAVWQLDDSALRPFKVMAYSLSRFPTLLSLKDLYTLLFSALSRGCDASLDTADAALLSGTTVEGDRCVHGALEEASPPTTLFSSFPADTSHALRAHLHIVHVLRLQQVGSTAQRQLEDLLRHLPGLPSLVVFSLLSIPTDPALLRLITQHAISRNGGVVDASLFALLTNALLGNDNFFRCEQFAAMHSIMDEIIITAMDVDGRGFDYLSVRWTPIMNKWARVYTKRNEGEKLYAVFQHLIAVVPAVETKIPCTFYVRLAGALVDAGTTAPATDVAPTDQKTWEHLKEVAVRALRLFGRDPAALRQVWVVVLKAALTLPPAEDDCRRVLEAYHLCAQYDQPIVLDRGAFQQVIRLTSAAITRQTTETVGHTVELFCRFLDEEENVSFLWVLDGIGLLLGDLWENHGTTARAQAVSLVEHLRSLLKRRGAGGVELESNPTIARVLEHYLIGTPAAFWWFCGCGAEAPSTSKRCVKCLRACHHSWTCTNCGGAHDTACKSQPCRCGSPNPRMAAACFHGYRLCPSCGDCVQPGAVCATCHVQAQREGATTLCPTCSTWMSANALYCPQCFRVRTGSSLSLWRCDVCFELNYSIWSACQNCPSHTPKRTASFTYIFAPWRCGCGALNHPCRLFCKSCSTHAESIGWYTCTGCGTQQPFRDLDEMAAYGDGSGIQLVHACPTCHTVHPRDQVLLHSPSLPRYCMCCGRRVRLSDVATDGSFYHCGVVQSMNENVVFQCGLCAEAGWQTGYHCAACHQPRPELRDFCGAAPHFVWRCLREVGDDASLCGQWNYSWTPRCLQCGGSRADTVYECRAKARLWTCSRCGHHNRPIDVFQCASCGSAASSVDACETCGQPHLTRSCCVKL